MRKDVYDTFILYLAGVADMKNEKEIWSKNEYGTRITFEFPTGNPAEFYYVRGYFADGKLMMLKEVRNDCYLEKCTFWYDNGQKYWEQNFINALPHGQYIRWDRDGKVIFDEEYKEGKLVKVAIGE